MDSMEKQTYDEKTGALLSIVIPAFNEEGNIRKLYDEIQTILPSLNLPVEIIFADDGSQDGTWSEITSLNRQDNRVKAIRLSRNFGHQYALLAGLSSAAGDAVVTMDADLQHPPQLIPKLVEEWGQGNQIVHTVRLDPKTHSFFKRLTSKLFYKCFSMLSGVTIQSGMADFRLLDRQVVDSVLEFREGGLFLRGIVQWVGYTSSEVTFEPQNRFSGATKYTLKKMVAFAWNSITSFSIVPVRIGIFIGLLTSAIAFGELIFAVYSKLFTDTVVPGWASAVSIISFLFGILFIMLGLIGEYIGRILVEVKHRPRFLISEILGIKDVIE
jgi:dolichol-phosphate mannosyltransferase